MPPRKAVVAVVLVTAGLAALRRPPPATPAGRHWPTARALALGVTAACVLAGAATLPARGYRRSCGGSSQRGAVCTRAAL